MPERLGFRQPMLTGILGVLRLPPQCTFWRFLASLHLGVARKTARLVDELKAADWKPSPRTDADGQCEFFYQPEGWGQAYRFLALRYEKQPVAGEADAPTRASPASLNASIFAGPGVETLTRPRAPEPASHTSSPVPFPHQPSDFPAS